MTISHKICSYTPVFIQMFTLIPSTFHLHSSQSNLSCPLSLHQQGLESQCVGLLYLGVLGKASLLSWPFYPHLHMHVGFPGGTSGKEPPAYAGDIRDVSLTPGLGRSPREGNGNPLQYSCLENTMDRGAWRVTVHRVAKSQTRLSN